MGDLRALPSVDQVLKTRTAAEMIATSGRPLTLEAIRDVLAEARRAARKTKIIPAVDEILSNARSRLQTWLQPTLVPVINASGVVLHTNLGRAPLSRAAMQAVQSTAMGYSTLEYDLDRGARGLRFIHTESLLTKLTGAQAAMVVNNNAGAVLLALTAFARRRRVVIARSQLVEIGGGFRIPDVMRESGARLVEVGTTNRVHLSDYEQALQEPAAAILQAHHSNYRIIGFTSEPSLAEIAQIAGKYNVHLIHDLGSGALIDTERFGLAHEATVQESIAAGADIICFSGDKLLGGPQSGILVGKNDLIAKMKQHPLTRALRPDKLCLAALSATLMHYLKDEVEREVPIWQMIARTPKEIRARAQNWRTVIGQGELIDGLSTIGGGSLPEETLPTCLLALQTFEPEQMLVRLRRMHPPILARIHEDRVVLDARTVLPEQDGALLVGLQNALSHPHPTA